MAVLGWTQSSQGISQPELFCDPEYDLQVHEGTEDPSMGQQHPDLLSMVGSGKSLLIKQQVRKF